MNTFPGRPMEVATMIRSACALSLCLFLQLAANGQTEQSSGKDKTDPLKDAQRLNAKQEKDLDEIVERFIQYDIGRLQGEDGKRAVEAFNRLDARAIPALTRGLNRAANLAASCPISVISSRIRALVSTTDDLATLDASLRIIGQGVINTQHLNVLQSVRDDMLRYRVALAQGKLTVRDIAVRQLYRSKESVLKDSTKHQSADVRWASARVISGKGLRLGDELITLLADKDADVSRAAHEALKRLACGVDFGPTKDTGEASRLDAADQWRKWWDADQLCSELANANGSRQDELLAKLQAGKGVVFTQALARAIPKLVESDRPRARNVLADRLTRMNTETLRDKLRDEDPEIRRAGALAAAMKEEKGLAPDIITLLYDKEPLVVRAALASLKSLSGQDFGPDPNASPIERNAAVRQWRAWFEKQAKPR
jgi:hypothetical protein